MANEWEGVYVVLLETHSLTVNSTLILAAMVLVSEEKSLPLDTDTQPVPTAWDAQPCAAICRSCIFLQVAPVGQGMNVPKRSLFASG